jgi:hypothetical protein
VGGREGVQTDARNKYMRTGDGAVDTGLQNEERMRTCTKRFQVDKKYQQRLVESLRQAAGSARQRQ